MLNANKPDSRTSGHLDGISRYPNGVRRPAGRWRDGAAICGMEKMAVLICCPDLLLWETGWETGHPNIIVFNSRTPGCPLVPAGEQWETGHPNIIVFNSRTPGCPLVPAGEQGCECPCATEKLAVPYCSDLDWFPRSSPGVMSEDLDTQTPGHPGLGIQRETGQPTTQTPTNAKTPHPSNLTHPGVTGERTDVACDGQGLQEGILGFRK